MQTTYSRANEEIANVERWTNHNNLKLNHPKSAEIIFVRPRSKGAVHIPPRTISDFVRVELIKVLGVTISRKFSVSKHVDQLLTSCAQSLFELRRLRLHGLPTEALQAVFQAIVINKLTYASPAWWGLASADDQMRLEAFLRRCHRLGYCDDTSRTFNSICADADERLFN